MRLLPDWFLRNPTPGPGEPVLEFAALWGDWLMDVRHLPAQGVVRIGEGGLPGPLEHLLFEDGELLLPHGTEGRVLEDGVWRPFQGGPLHQSGRYWVTSGGFSWLVRWVPPGTRLPAAREVRRETGLLMSLGVSGFLAALLWIVAVTAPPSPQVTLEEIRDQFAKVTLAQPEPKKTTRPMPPVSAPEQQTEGSRASGREGSRGQVSHALRKVMEQRRSDRAIAEGAGFLGALSQEGVFGDMFSNTGLGDGLVDAIGDMEGPSGKGQLGTGLGWNSNGPGAGGKVATDSRGSGTTGRGGDGRSLDGGGPAGTKKQGAVTVSGEVIRVGGMDAALIDGVVKQHLNSFRYCYQRQLQRDPTLRGKVTLKWVIAGDGSVSSAAVKTDTTGNGVVGTCMAGVARRMRFPEPKGGLVIVSYPFLFSPQ